MLIRFFTTLMLATCCGPAHAAHGASDSWSVNLRKQVRNDRGEFEPVEEAATWDPARTAIIVIDMWNDHSCKSAAARVAEMAPHMNRVLHAARNKGVFVVHSPSGCMDAYRDTPARQRAQNAFAVPASVKFQWNYFNPDREGTLDPKLEQAGCSCDTLEPCRGKPNWTSQIATIDIDDSDAVTDNGQEVHNLLTQRGTENVIVMGVHTNRCVLGRPFGIRQMVYLGRNVVLCRDLTDSFHRDPGNHFSGLECIIAHVEKYWCPTITSASITGGRPFSFSGRDRGGKSVIADHVAALNSDKLNPRGRDASTSPADEWETTYSERLKWWSLQPIRTTDPPPVKQPQWVRNEIDHFIRAALEANGLEPAPEADRRTIARRLSFALTGLPPAVETVEQFAADPSPLAYESLVQSLLASPHFGEHWARHWMDVVHYSDTHGYEWDAPAKNAWRYRDYLVRAFNADVPFQRLVLEQIAGDLIEPRIDSLTGVNESLLAPMALRLGERRHGDSAQVEGVTQEAVANVIDTVGKGFLGTTIACAQCHDHKLDAVSQRDYYALAGVFMSTRWGARSADTADPNAAVIDELRGIKLAIRDAIAQRWLEAKELLVEKIKAIPADEKAATTFPESLAAFWQRSLNSPVTAEDFAQERQRRTAENQANLQPLADFTREDGAAGWRWDGFGMRHGLVGDGELVVADEGNVAIAQILPAGRWSHVWSPRLAGAISSPLFDLNSPVTFSVELAADKHAARSFILDQAFHSERMQFINQPTPRWLTLTAGNFDTLEGSVDRANRRVYLELVTKSLNNYFPPRTNYGGAKEADIASDRSWLGVTRIYRHPPGKPPLDELARFAPLFEKGVRNLCPQPGDDAKKVPDTFFATSLADLVAAAIGRWSRNECGSEDARLLDEAIQLKLLPNDLESSPELAKLVMEYRTAEQKLQLDQTIGSAADWNEGRDERIGIRGSYTEFGAEVPRGNIALFGGAASRTIPSSSGRLELARSIASDQNPLTARVFVNRVWLHLFGDGVVRTPDDFGHLGQLPTHPELLDYLAARFMREDWSLKKLVALLVTSATWRQSSQPRDAALAVDAENRLWHHMPLRRLEAESIRDAMLAVSGQLDARLYGPPVDPHRTATDASKRLFSGPIDGDGRRSIYTKMTLMEPPRFLALFNQPLPKLTTGRRDVTNVPDQALALLNDPFVIATAKHWSEQALKDGATSPDERVQRMFAAALARPASPDETARLVKLAQRSAELRWASASSLLPCEPAWQDVAHAIFNLKEFIYVP
jgi:nicotinamidase-related amidase